jgi:hypothetical protein
MEETDKDKTFTHLYLSSTASIYESDQKQDGRASLPWQTIMLG